MAYAAVISLKHTIERLENPINKPQITKSVYQDLDSLVSMLKRLDVRRSRCIDRNLVNDLDAKIRDEVWKVEDVLESSHSLNISTSEGHGDKGVEQVIDSFLKTVKMLREEYIRVLESPLSEQEEDDDAAVSPIHDDDVAGSKSTTVGLSDLSENIINELLRKTCKVQTVSLVGMAGIGKTHLAKQIYHHPLILEHFDLRLWVSVGPKDQMNNILVDIVAQIEGKPRDLFKGKSVSELGYLVRERLRSTRKYLIVLDDIWTKQVFRHFKDFLPYVNLNRKDFFPRKFRCRFLLTTRLEEVAKRSKIHRMPFLNNEASWNLLWQNVFLAERSFPSALEKAGRKIAEKCEGLPLLILAMANILRGLDKTEEYWEKVAEEKTTTFIDAYDQIYEVLLPSYEYLPQHLKPCFLYMGVFRKRCEIPTSKLFSLWAVEDFLAPTRHQELEWFAEKEDLHQELEWFAIECMEDLVSKSLAIVCRRSFSSVRRIKSSKLHSAYWYLCVREARKNKFFHALKKLTEVFSIERPRRLSFQNNILFGITDVYDFMASAASTTRSLLFTGEDHQYPVPVCFNMMMLMRVLDALAIRFYEFPEEVVKLLQLRYLSLTHNGELPSSINKLQQLQYLILRRHHNIIKLVQRDSGCLPEEIWDMQELRHLRIMGSNLPDPSKDATLPKLLTLYVNANSCTEDVFRGIPHLKKLGIRIELQPEAGAESLRCLEIIGVLHELESLKCVVVNPRLKSSRFTVSRPAGLLYLPKDLKKLSLNGLGYSWMYMSAFCSLKYLKVMKLRCSAFQGPHWEIKGGQFESLEFLLLEDIDLVHWTAEYWTFNKFLPSLCHLIVRHCYKLKKIPLEFGDISTLEMIEVDDCSPSVVDSAQKVKDKTKSSGFQLVINSSWQLP